MNAPTDAITVDITALSHDGRGIARLAPADGQGRGAVVFVTNALPGQTVLARITRRKSSFIEAEALRLLHEAPDATQPICPHHADCGGCPLQTMPYERQLFWKRTIALDALSRIGGLDRSTLETLLGPVAPSPAAVRFRNKMEFAFGPDASREYGFVLGLRRRNGRDVVAVPECALMPAEALRMVDMVGKLAAKSGLAAYVPPDTRPDSRPSARSGAGATTRRRTSQGKYTDRGNRHETARRVPNPYCAAQQATAAPGFWRFFVLRRGLAADLRTPRWWALCITSPGDAQQRAAVRALGREVLAAFPQLYAFIHEERATADAFAFGEKRVQTLDATGMDNPAAARLFQPLNGAYFALDAASFFQVNTAAAQVLARTAQSMLTPQAEAAPENRGLLDLYCGVGAPGLLLAADYTALLGLEQDARAVKLAKINAANSGLRHCRYEAGDAAQRLERLAACGAQNMWAATHSQTALGDNEAADAATDAANPALHAGATLPSVTDALVDPPRAGLSPRALDALLRIAPKRILYISCNPSTLARDAAQLRCRYRLERLAVVDLFPHTPHLETLSLWRKT
ncbi:class I SAM-dependent RNA methyltransferase [Desulfovibrio desulfuricans]|uniref:class I SAM-dependent RNA methyltransferase n=1 Tax=Desulfovibrio desulfuricans TaxID=876 RepID=UPI0035B0D1C6